MSEEHILEKLRDSLINSKEEIETKGLEQLVKTSDNPNDAIELVKKIDKLTKRSKNNILMLGTSKESYFKNLNKIALLLTL